MQIAWQQLVGRTLAERYRLTHFIDAGSYGGVFEADELVADTVMRSIAIKLLRPPELNSRGQPPTAEQRDAMLDAQLHELQLSSRLEHPHLIRSYSVGITELPAPAPAGLSGELLYIVMELGEATLADQLPDRPLLAPEALELARQLAAVLNYLHNEAEHVKELPLVHRDLKPANVLRVISPRGGFRWKLSDLGTVRAFADQASPGPVQLGTLEYAPPESFSGQSSPAWDMWSLGVLLCEALSGSLPFGSPELSDPADIQHSILHDEPRLPQSLRPPFTRLLTGLLQKQPAQRLSAAEAVALLAATDSPATLSPVPAQAKATGTVLPPPMPLRPPSPPVQRDPLTQVASLAHDSHGEALLRQAVQRALDDKLLSSFERGELNELRKRLDIRLERAAQIFREEHARALNPTEASAPVSHTPSPAAPLLAPPVIPAGQAPDPQSFRPARVAASTPPPSLPPSPPAAVSGERAEFVVDADSSRAADFRSISEAITAVRPGSRIQIRTGLYRENLQIDKAVELQGYDSRGQVLIQSPDRHGIIVNCDGVVLRRLHVVAGQRGSGTTSDLAVSPLVVSSGRLEAEDCVFECHSENCVAVFGATSIALLRRCEISGGRSVGLSATHDARAVAEQCNIHSCGLAGVSCSNGGALRLLRSRISQCRGYGALVYVEGLANLRECEITNNAQDGVAFKNGGRGEIENCRITANQGAGVQVQAGSHAAIRGCNLSGNRGRAFNILRGATAIREANVE